MRNCTLWLSSIYWFIPGDKLLYFNMSYFYLGTGSRSCENTGKLHFYIKHTFWNMVLEFWQHFSSAFNDKYLKILYLLYIFITLLLIRCFSNLAYSFSYIDNFIKSFSYILTFNFWKSLKMECACRMKTWFESQVVHSYITHISQLYTPIVIRIYKLFTNTFNNLLVKTY